jgi:hypothetical protein
MRVALRTSKQREVGSISAGPSIPPSAPPACSKYRGCVFGAIGVWTRGRAASRTSLRSRRNCALANPGLDARVLQQAATSTSRAGPPKPGKPGRLPSCSTPPPGPALRDWHAPNCPAVPWMPRIADFTDVTNMGVVLLSCIIASAIIKGRGTFCYSLVLRRYRGAGCHRSSVASASAVSSSITIAGPHEFLDHTGST